METLENQSDHNDVKLGPECRPHHPDHGGVNGSSIQARIRENEPVKVLVKVGLCTKFKFPTIRPTLRHET